MTLIPTKEALDLAIKAVGYSVRNGFQWWAVTTGIFALAGLGNILGALEQSQPAPSGTKPAA